MPVYRYTATTPLGATRRGRVVAQSPRLARDEIRSLGLRIVELGAGRGSRTTRRASATRDDRPRASSRPEAVELLRELATLLRVGVPVLEAGEVLGRQLKGRSLLLLTDIRERIEAGGSLGDAMEANPRSFDVTSVRLARVGESTGQISEALDRYCDHWSRWARLRGRLLSAMLYPAIVLAGGVGVSIFLMTVVVPDLLDTLVQSGRPLPVATTLVRGASQFLVGWWWALLLGAGLLVVVGASAMRAPRLRRVVDRWILMTPLIGAIVRKQETVRLSVLLSTLLRSGIQLDESLHAAADSIRNTRIREALRRCHESIRLGAELGPAIEQTGVLPPAVAKVFAVGQESGELASMLDRLAEDLDAQVQVSVGRLTALLEPVLIVALAAMVGLIAFATLMPILEAGDVL